MAVIFYAQPRFQVFDCAIEMNSGKITVNLVAIHYCPADNQSCSVLIQRLYSHNNRIKSRVEETLSVEIKSKYEMQ